jgi:hypothetical protein
VCGVGGNEGLGREVERENGGGVGLMI